MALRITADPFTRWYQIVPSTVIVVVTPSVKEDEKGGQDHICATQLHQCAT
jgi:hypothetical protein